MFSELSDAQLLQGISNADGFAFQEIVRRHGSYLYGLARTLTNDSSEAEDVVQEALIALLKTTYRGESSVKTFLTSILIRQAGMVRRKRRSWLRIVPDVKESSIPSSQNAIDAKLDLAELLEQLSPEHREVIVLRELQGMSYDDMARLLDVPRGTIESRLSRARETLRQLWKK